MKISIIDKVSKNDFVWVGFDEKISESFFVIENGKKELKIKTKTSKKISRRELVILARQIISFSRKNKLKKIVVNFKDFLKLKIDLSKEEIFEILSTNFEMANYEFVKYKTKPKEGWNFIEEIKIVADKKEIKNLNKFLKRGQTIGQEVNLAREISNTPGGEMTPNLLAQKVRSLAKGTEVKVKVMDEKEMKKLKMEAILGVSKGSAEKPRFIVLEYDGKKEEKPIVLIGKAITFDTGGVSLKPAEYMKDMHMDMSGGAAVASAVVLAAKLGIKKRIIGIIPAAENMPSGGSYRPGDILKSMSGKTIEVLNTDAEGRIILADALTYAEKYNPRLVVDVATLTGAVAVALGERASGIFSKDEKILKEIQELGEESGDYVWPLPLWDEYENEILGTTGDVANLKNKGNAVFGGATSGAMFLYQFAKKFKKWVHIDMGSRINSVYDEFLSKGSAGVPIRLLIKIIEKY